MDIRDVRYCAQFPECRDVMENGFEINQSIKVKHGEPLDLIPDSESLNCICYDIDEIPKVFPKHSTTRSTSLIDSCSSNLDYEKNNTCQPTGFFQKVMENAKSILNMKCSSIHPANAINEEPTKDIDTCGCESADKQWPSTNSTNKGLEFASLPMCYSSDDCVCDEESTKNDTSVESYSCSVSCSCKNSDEQSKEEGTCLSKTHTIESNISRNNTYKIIDSSRSDYNTYKTGSTTKSDYKTRNVKSNTCSCTVSRINTATYSLRKDSRKSCCCGTSKAVISDKVVQSKVDNYDASCGCAVKMHSTGTKIYPISGNFDNSPQNISKSLPLEEILLVKCPNIALSDKMIGVTDSLKKSSGLAENEPVICELKNCWVNTKQTELRDANVGVKKGICSDQCSVQVNIAKSSTAPNVSYGKQIEKRKSVCNIGTCPSAKRLRSRSCVRDQNDQCAFVGSPILKAFNFTTGLGDTKSTFCCLPKKNKSSQIFSMINEMATQEKEMKDQIQVLIEREKNYDSVLKNFQKMIKKPSCCCPSTQDSDPRSEIEKISQELKIENGILKSEMMELKLELKHCLEKVEGPMKQRLETERSKCIQLQQDLNEASENMISNQDVYLREMNTLKMQLCAACSNMTELSTINKRLKSELDALDCMCTKLEDDLVKQKLSEAETIRRLKKRLPVKTVDLQPSPLEVQIIQPAPVLREPLITATSFRQEESKDTLCSDSNLHSIARKLSRTLKESAPCEECSKLPAELTEAAKCIKDLTDMVESRKINKYRMDLVKDSYAQSPPTTQETFCQCSDLRDIATGASKTINTVEKSDNPKSDETTKTLFAVPPNVFMSDTVSSHLNVKVPQNNLENPTPVTIQPTSQTIASMYFSASMMGGRSKPYAETGPYIQQVKPCSIFQVPEIPPKPVEKLKFSENAVSCTLIGTPCIKGKVNSVRKVSGELIAELPQDFPQKKSANTVNVKSVTIISDEEKNTLKNGKESNLPKKNSTEIVHIALDGSAPAAMEKTGCFAKCEGDCVVAGNSCTFFKMKKVISDTINDVLKRSTEECHQVDPSLISDKLSSTTNEKCARHASFVEDCSENKIPMEPMKIETQKVSPVSAAENESTLIKTVLPESLKRIPIEMEKHEIVLPSSEQMSTVPTSGRKDDYPILTPPFETQESYPQIPSDEKNILKSVDPSNAGQSVSFTVDKTSHVVPEILKDYSQGVNQTAITAKATSLPEFALKTTENSFITDPISEGRSCHASCNSDRLTREHINQKQQNDTVSTQNSSNKITVGSPSARDAAKYVKKVLIESMEEETLKKDVTFQNVDEKKSFSLDDKSPSGMKEEVLDESIEKRPQKTNEIPTAVSNDTNTKEVVDTNPSIPVVEESLNKQLSDAAVKISVTTKGSETNDTSGSPSVEISAPPFNSNGIDHLLGGVDKLPESSEKEIKRSDTTFSPTMKIMDHVSAQSPDLNISKHPSLKRNQLNDKPICSAKEVRSFENQRYRQKDGYQECSAKKPRIFEAISDNFPFKVETSGIVLTEPPPGLILTTIITNSGNLEVITEGPAGIIETELIYKENGVIEVVTQITEMAAEDVFTPTEGEMSVDFIERMSQSDGLDSEPKRISGTAKTEFDEERQVLIEKALAKGSMLSGASGLTGLDTETPSSQIKMSGGFSSMSKPSQFTNKSLITTEASSGLDKTDTSAQISTSAKLVSVGEQLDDNECRVALMASSKSNATEKKMDFGVQNKISVTFKGITTDADTTDTNIQQTSAVSTVSAGVTSGQTVASSQQTSAVCAVDAEMQGDMETCNQQTSGISAVCSRVKPGQNETSIQQTSAVSATTKTETSVQKTSAVSAISTGVTPEKIKISLKQTSAVSTAAVTPSEQSRHEGSTLGNAMAKMEKVKDVVESESKKDTENFSAPPGQIFEVGESLTDQISSITENEIETSTEISPDYDEVFKSEEVATHAQINEFKDTENSITENLSELPKGFETKKSAAIQYTEQPLESQKVDCACQSSIPIEQSCQCCECKDIGVSTSKDTETATEHIMTGEKLPKSIQKDSQSDTFHTAGDGVTLVSKITEETDEAIATPISGRTHGTTDEISTINEESESKSFEQPGQTKSISDKAEPEVFESAIEFTQATLKDKGISKDTVHFVSESAAQQTDKITLDRSIGSGRIREALQNISKDISVPAIKCTATSYDKFDSPRPKSKGSSEVPDSVSKLSDKAMPPLTDSSDNKKNRKKRSSKLSDFQCACEGICSCEVCSPEVIAKRIATTGRTSPSTGSPYRLCCCSPPVSHKQIPQVQTQPYAVETQNVYMQSQILHTPTIDHPTNCTCYLCKCQVCSPCIPGYGTGHSHTEAFLKSTSLDNQAVLSRDRQRINIDDIFAPVVETIDKDKKSGGCRANIYVQKENLNCYVDCPKPSECLDTCETRPVLQKVNHPSHCECVDCLCFPKIKEIAQTVEFPIINDEKQIYQVQTMKCACINAQNSKKMERSRIPIPTNSRANPPTAKHGASCDCETCQCNPCADPSKRQKQPEKIDDLSKLCDCGDCKCEVCFNKPPANEEEELSEQPTKEAKDCCCQDGCTCEVCLVNDLQKKLEEVSRQLNEQVSKMSTKPSKMSKLSEKPSRLSEKPSKLSEKPSKLSEKPSKLSEKPSKLSEKPSKLSDKLSKMSKQPSKIAHPLDCDCYECNCPVNSTMSKTPSKLSEPAQQPLETISDHPNDCECYECFCIKTPLPQTVSKLPTTPSKLPDVASKRTVQLPPTLETSHPADCDCYECTCAKIALSAKASKMSEKRSEVLQSKTSATGSAKVPRSDCDCYECKCVKSQIQKPSDEKGDSPNEEEKCTCPKCVCPGNKPMKPITEETPQSETPAPPAEPACDCLDCKCSPCSDPKKKMGEKETPKSSRPSIPCDCAECECSPCADSSKKKQNVAPDDKISQIDRPHPENCTCDACLCAEEAESEMVTAEEPVDGCNCEICECPGKDMVAKTSLIGKGEVIKVDQQSTPAEEHYLPGDGIEVGVGTKDNKATHPSDCTCDECKCEEQDKTTTTSLEQTGIVTKDSKATHPPNCTCDECQCVEQDGTTEVSDKQDIQGMSHLSDCNCYECRCKVQDITTTVSTKRGIEQTVSTRIDEGKKDKEIHPADCICDTCLSEGHKKHEKGCCCLECKCIECNMKTDTATHSMICRCKECLCKECEFEKATITDHKGDSTEITESKSLKLEGVGDNAKSPDGWYCVQCDSPECYYKTHPQTASQKCKCEPCLCQACEFQKEMTNAPSIREVKSNTQKPINPEQSCHCAECACDVCNNTSNQAKFGDKEVIAKVSVRDQACHSTSCDCQTCVGKSEVEVKQLVAKGKFCKCFSCLCINCLGESKSTRNASNKENLCNCGECLCDDCVWKKETVMNIENAPSTQVPIQETGSKIQSPVEGDGASLNAQSGHHPNCKCETCSCGDCLSGKPTPSSIAQCKCKICDCINCSFKNGKPAVIKTSAYATPIGAESKSYSTSNMEPPPFEIPTRKQCDCKPCDCIICTDRHQILSRTEQKISKQNTVVDTPLFEMPLSLGCNCPICKCISCNKDIIQVTKSNPESEYVIASNQQAASSHKRPASAPSGTSRRAPVHCNCPTCICPNDTAKGLDGKNPSVHSKYGSNVNERTGEVNHPQRCTCGTCDCEEIEKQMADKSSNIIGKESHLSGKQSKLSEKASTVNHPNQCTCSSCNCTEEITKLIYGKQINNTLSEPSTMTNQKQSEKNVVIIDKSSKASAKVSHLSGKSTHVSEKASHISGKSSHVSGKNSHISGHISRTSENPCQASEKASHVSGKASHVSEKASHVSEKASHVSEKASLVSEKASHVSEKASHVSEKTSHVSGRASHLSEKASHVSEKKSHFSEKASYVSEKSSHVCDKSSHVCDIASRVSEKASHVSEKASHVSEKASHVSEKASHISGKASHVSGKPSGTSGKLSTHVDGDSVQISEDFSPCCPCTHKVTIKRGNCSCICHENQQMSETDKNISEVRSNLTNMSGKPSNVISAQEQNIQEQMGVGNKESQPQPPNSESTQCPAKLESIDISKLDDVTLIKKIESGKKENCECREQIKEIRRALNKIKCACTVAEIKAGKNKPFIKQASAFGQTMSGLKLALHNLQEKCKAKDKMIEAMTGELKSRTSSNTFNKVLNTSLPDVLDYDRAKNVRSVECSREDPVPTNILYSVNEEKEMKVSDFEAKMSKAISAEKQRVRSRTSRICKCGKSHRDRDTHRVSLSGFEIIDIRRITQDSIIIKWKSPKSNLVTGYDIFVNGVHKSKVMSGGRTSAMIHSLDLSSTIQITIYAVTKCGRCEPPAIAIYEIK